MYLGELIAGQASNTFIQFLRYSCVGGIAFVIDFGSLYILTEYAGFYYIVSATISFLLGLVINYVLSTIWVFAESRFNKRLAEFLIFAIIGLIGLGLNNLFLYIFTDKLNLYYMVSKLITAALVMLWNFFARKIILFTK